MRMMIKFTFPVAAGNNAQRSGRLQRVFRQLTEDLKPEADYVFPSEGKRSGFFIVEMRESAQVADIAERFFFGLDAEIEMVPVMAPEDLDKALSGLQNTIERYG
jgi:Domain of unknown function (DUF3303)